MNKKYIGLPNGEELAYLDMGKGEDVLVLVHGNMSSSIHYKPLIEKFESDYRLIIPDMRGFGDSSYFNKFDDLEDLADDLIMLLDALDIKEYNAAGWSTGGAVVLSMATKRPKQVKKLILIESCSYRGYPIFKKDEKGQPILGSYYENKEDLAKDPIQVANMQQIFETNAKPYMKAVWDAVIYTVNKPTPEDDDLYLDETLKERCLVDIDWALTRFNMSHATNGVTEGNGLIDEVICPVISFWGDSDAVVLEYMVDETVAALKDGKKVKLEKSGHNPLVDCPDVLEKEIRAFLK